MLVETVACKEHVFESPFLPYENKDILERVKTGKSDPRPRRWGSSNRASDVGCHMMRFAGWCRRRDRGRERGRPKRETRQMRDSDLNRGTEDEDVDGEGEEGEMMDAVDAVSNSL